MLFAQLTGNTRLMSYLLKKMQIRHTPTYLHRELLSHQAFPALSSFQDTLKLFGVHSMAVQLPPEKLEEVPLPALVHLQTAKGEFVVLDKYSQASAVYFSADDGIKQESSEHFTQKISGHILLLAPTDKKEEPDYSYNKQKTNLERLRLSFIFIFLIASWGVCSLLLAYHSIPLWLTFMLKSVGLGLSVGLFAQEMNFSVGWIEKTCTLHKQMNCKNVLSSPAAKLFTWLSMVDIGFIYFGTGLLLCCFALISSYVESFLFLLFFISLSALPYTIFSIYYQGKVLKQWCILCLGVQAILWIESLLLFVSLPSFDTSVIKALLLLVFVSCFVITVWLVLKPLLIDSLKSENILIELKKTKKDKSLLKYLLSNQKQIQTSLPSPTILPTSKEGTIEFTLVINPYCNPCKTVYKQFKQFREQWLSDTPSMLRIVFLGSLQAESQVQKVVNTFLYWQKEDTSKFDKALDDWFAQGMYQPIIWLSAYYERDADMMCFLQEKHLNWIHLHQIHQTPTLFINGFEMPSNYQINDLVYHLSDLKSMQQPT